MRPEVVEVGLRGYPACVLLLEPELLAIALCIGFARSELGIIDSISGLVI